MTSKIQMLGIMILVSASIFGAEGNSSTHAKHYNVSASIVSSGSGQGMGYSISTGINAGRKTLEAGIIFDQRDGKISGGSVQYRIKFRNIIGIEDWNTMYVPYMQYHLIYQKSLSYAPDVVELEGKEYIITTEPGVVATMGHYLETGTKIRIFEKFYLDASMGLGAYFGSLDKINGPGTWGIHHSNNGFTYACKVGICYLIHKSKR
jgi:hypothetical protein